MIKKLDHIGIAVKSIEEALPLYTDLFGLTLEGIEEVEEQKVKTAFLPIGDTEFELLESKDPEGPIARFIDKKGQGIQHIALQVENIEEALEKAKRNGIRLIDEKPRYGAGGAKIAFLHPQSTQGVLIELCQRDK